MNVLADSLKVVIAILIAFGVAWFFLFDDIKAVRADVQLLKTEIKAVRVYLMAFPVPGQCRGPGMQETSILCPYSILITDVTHAEKGLYSGKIAPKVYEESVTECEKAKETLLPEFKDLISNYKCRSPKENPSSETVYTFYIDDLDYQKNPVKVGDTLELQNKPGSRHLMKSLKAK